jgi:hypothetical protein
MGDCFLLIPSNAQGVFWDATLAQVLHDESDARSAF